MLYEEVTWHADGHDFSIGLDRVGTGPTLLLLPAPSSISTRRELRPLQERLARSYSTLCIDLPGFGTLQKPAADWRPALYDEFLSHLFIHMMPKPHAVIAAGHASGYVLRHFSNHTHPQIPLVFLSPTWRGPLPTMMNGDRGFFRNIVKAIDLPGLGYMLYRLNVNKLVVGMMARGHVYEDSGWLSAERLEGKMAVTHTKGARYASARFVCGRLDPFHSREQQIDTIKAISNRMLNLYSVNAPRKSRLEMEALTGLPQIKSKTMPRGKLSFYEEYADETAEAVGLFLTEATGC